jgi:hypothetical protein
MRRQMNLPALGEPEVSPTPLPAAPCGVSAGTLGFIYDISRIISPVRR